MSLKDGAGLVKMYAFVDVNQYQIVGTGNSVESARADYISKLKTENVTDVPEAEKQEVTGVIVDITSAVIEGNTVYYLKLENNATVYTVLVTKSDRLPFAQAGDTVTLALNGTVIEAITFAE
jgi:hypothetical protein